MIVVLSDDVDENRRRFGVSSEVRPQWGVLRCVGVLGDNRNAAVRTADLAVAQLGHRSLLVIASAEACGTGAKPLTSGIGFLVDVRNEGLDGARTRATR